ncbi:hypothetical protein B0A50_08726 [Salinomyces thailandicus]|uniref:CID domain-containing protein n=1 Tax=Salinomyces thailandicus TaxID=706561 RepID=A0A4U0TJ83_9PEZI|nr:hypothetical protein B0A50_08726 [Salinomyces thailandica]
MAYSADAVRAKLASLNETQDSIVANAQWIMFHRRHADATANLWLERLHASPAHKRLVLVYLANEVVQQSRARGKPDFLNAFEPLIAEATAVAYKGQSADVHSKIRRVVDVWRQRTVFDPRILDGVDARLAELDKTKSAKAGGKLGGSLFGGPNGAGSSTTPAELHDAAKSQAALSKAELAKTPALDTADKEYAKLTDPTAVLPTPPVHAARLSALMRNLASAQGAVEASIQARRELLDGLTKLVESNHAKLDEEEKSAEELRIRKEGVEVRKRDVEDGIMRGLSAPTSPTAGILTSADDPQGQIDETSIHDFATASEPAAPETEGFTPPSEGPEPESFTPPAIGGYDDQYSGVDAALSAGDNPQLQRPMPNPTGADVIETQPSNLDEPPPAFEPPPALETGPTISTETAANDFLDSLGASMPPQQQGITRQVSREVPADISNGSPGDPRLKRRKMSHKSLSANDLDNDIFGDGGSGTGVDEDGISAMLAGQ